MPLAHHAQQLPLLSVYYHFVNASSTPPLSPRSSCGDSETDAMSALSRESSVSAHLLVRPERLPLTLSMPPAELPFPFP